MEKSQAPLDILAFGDSLTEGMVSWFEFCPYSDRLTEKLQAHYGNGRKVTVTQKGISGESVGEMTRRLPKLLKAKEEAGEKYTHVVILGGTNDLGMGKSAEAILELIKQLHEAAHQHGAVTVAVTIPEGVCPIEWYVQKRQAINKGLSEWAADRTDKVVLLDLETEIPHLNINAEQEKMWADGLHFSSAGYNRFGELVFEALKANGQL